MKTVEVLGSGCPSCVSTARLVEENARALGVEGRVEKVTDMSDILAYGVMRTPALVVDGAAVHSGGVPRPAQVRDWLAR